MLNSILFVDRQESTQNVVLGISSKGTMVLSRFLLNVTNFYHSFLKKIATAVNVTISFAPLLGFPKRLPYGYIFWYSGVLSTEAVVTSKSKKHKLQKRPIYVLPALVDLLGPNSIPRLHSPPFRMYHFQIIIGDP